MPTSTKKNKRSRGQAARIENKLDLNVAFSRAYKMFVKVFDREPNWSNTVTKYQILNGSVICDIQEE